MYTHPPAARTMSRSAARAAAMTSSESVARKTADALEEEEKERKHEGGLIAG